MAYIVTDYMPLKMPVPGSREPAQIALLNENSQLIAGHDHSAGEGIPVAVMRSGLSGNRPTAGEAGGFWFSTDNGLASLDTGAGWVDFITSAASSQVLRDPIVRDAVRFGPEGSGVIDVTIQRTGAGALTLEGTPLLSQALGDARYLRVGGQSLVNSVNGRTGVVTLTAVDVGALSQSAGDGRYVNVTGDSISGDLAIKSKYVAVSASANNVLTWNADGFFVPDPGVVPDVAITSNGSLGVTEVPANTFMIVVTLSTDSGNMLSLHGNGLYAQGATGLTQAAADLRYLQLTGGPLTGPISVQGKNVAVSVTAGNTLTWNNDGFYVAVPAPPDLSTYYTKVQSDARFQPVGTYLTQAAGDARYLLLSGGAVTGALSVAGKGVAASATAGNVLVWNADGFYVPAGGGGITQAQGDTRYVNVTGDAMTGQLAISNTGAVGLLVNNTGTWTAQINGPVLISLPTGGGSPIWAQVNSVKVFEVTQAGAVVFTPVSGYALDVTGDTMIRGSAIHLANAGVTVSAGWQYDNTNGGLGYIFNGAQTGTRFVGSAGGGLAVKGTVDITQGTEGLAGTWLNNSGGARYGFVGLSGDSNTWRVYSNVAGQQGDKISVDLTTGYVLVPGGFGVSGSIAVSGNINGNGGVTALSATNNIQLAPAGGYVHPDGDNTRSMGHPGLRWNYGYFVNVQADALRSTGYLTLDSGSGAGVTIGGAAIAIYPSTNGGPACGLSGNRWSGLWTTAGAINTSHVSAKEGFVPLDGAEALVAFRRTTFWGFDYKRADGFPEDGLRGRHGIVLGSEEMPADPYFSLPDGVSNEPTHYATGIAMALRGFMAEVEERLAALEGRPA